jgi:AcrR family transcriptional regulator
VELIERAAEMLAGPEPVTLRRLAAAAGTSTMAIYTHFGGMAGLWGAVRQEGFIRLGRRLELVAPSEDPVAHLMALGAAYVSNALADPHLYLTMFDARRDPVDPEAAGATFGVLVAGAARARDEGRFDPATDPEGAAIQMWAMAHGMVMLVLTGALELDKLRAHLPAMSAAGFTGFGDDPRAARASAAAGWATFDHIAGLP